jgi:hypothetical protein
MKSLIVSYTSGMELYHTALSAKLTADSRKCPHVGFLCPLHRYSREYKINPDKRLSKIKAEMEINVLWNETSCNLVDAYQHYR